MSKRKQIWLLVVIFDITWHRKDVKFVEVGKPGTGFCSSRKPRSWVEKYDFQKIIFMPSSWRRELPNETHHGVVIIRARFDARTSSSFRGVKSDT